MTAEFLEDFFTGTILHSLLNIVTNFIDVETISPENINILWLSSEVWLIWNNNTHEPVRVNETHQSSCAWSVLLEVSEHLEQLFILHCNSERLPNRFDWLHVEWFRVSKLARELVSNFLPDLEADCVIGAIELSWFSP